MQQTKYHQVYRNRIEKVLDTAGNTNPYLLPLIEFLFTRTLWIKRNGVYKAYIDNRGLAVTTLSLPPSHRLLILLMAVRHDVEQSSYLTNVYSPSEVRYYPFSLVEIFTLLANLMGEPIHKDLGLLLPISLRDILEHHLDTLHFLYPPGVSPQIANVLRAPSTSLMLDLRQVNKLLRVYTDHTLDTLVAPLVGHNPIGVALNHVAETLGLPTRVTNQLLYIYESLTLDVYLSNQ